MAVGALPRTANFEEIPPPPQNQAVMPILALDDQESAMLETILPKNLALREIVMDQIVSAFLEYPDEDKFIPLCLISHGMKAWTRDDLITAASMKWLVGYSFTLRTKMVEFDDQLALVQAAACKWEDLLRTDPLGEEVYLVAFLKLTQPQIE